MNYLALLTSIMAVAALPACTDKSTDSSTETTGSTGSTSTTDDGSTSTSGPDPTTSTATGDPESTSGSDTGDTTSSGTTTMPLDEDCAFLIGKKFVSKKQWPCGPPPDPDDPGPLCPDEVAFDAENGFFYQSGDFGHGGTYTCIAGVITGEADAEIYDGTIDATTGVLVWEGNEFTAE